MTLSPNYSDELSEYSDELFGAEKIETVNMFIGEVNCPHCNKIDYHCVNWDIESGKVVCLYCNAMYQINRPTAEALPADI